MKMQKMLYAAVGAPVVGYKKAEERVSDLRSKLNDEANSLGKTAEKRLTEWASEGQKLINKLSDAKVVDEVTSRVDFDQVSTQVNKLRDQLEDLLATWRSSFRPEKLPTVKMEASTDGVKFETIPAKKPAARKSTAKSTITKTAGRKPANKTTVKATVTKSTSAKKAVNRTGAKKAPARKSTAKASASA